MCNMKSITIKTNVLQINFKRRKSISLIFLCNILYQQSVTALFLVDFCGMNKGETCSSRFLFTDEHFHRAL